MIRDPRQVPAEDLPELAAEIRRFLIDKVSAAGGHLGPNLGVVELTMAMHRVFDSPRDVFLFDTGHQAYVHKILTGRADQFNTLRQGGGLSGYPCRAESEHDVIENSHASTALSYADGIAKGFALRGERERRVVAVIGDGALTGGMAWEALNNLGAATDQPVVIVLNDNGRSYEPTVGGIARHLADLRSRPPTNDTVPSGDTIFGQLGLAYLGPVDGHDLDAVEAALRTAGDLGRPVVVHCLTRKGNGYRPAEEDQLDRFHAVAVIDPMTGQPKSGGGRSWTSVFGEEIAAIGGERADVVCLTAAMRHPTGLSKFAANFPERTYDVGIAEQHAVTAAAGLATAGLHPVVAIYATFLNRALDQVLMDVALHRLPVTFVLDRAGITGPDGPSHHGVWDASVFPVVPGLRLAAPRDGVRLRELLRECVSISDGPTAIRYPKGTDDSQVDAIHHIDAGDVLRADRNARVLLVAVGPLASACLSAAEEITRTGVPVTVIDPRWVAPVNPALVRLADTHELTLTVEDTVTTGAMGGRIAQALAAMGSSARAATFALPTQFVPHGSRTAILRAHGLSAEGIATTVRKRLATS